MFFIGVKDDIISVSAFKKFFVQLLAAGIVMVIGDIRITSFQGIFGIYDLDPGISYAFTFLVMNMEKILRDLFVRLFHFCLITVRNQFFQVYAGLAS